MIAVWVSVTIAKFHFERDIKHKYLLAKDKVANDILNSTCGMLLNIWELVNINTWITSGQIPADDQSMAERRQTALNNFRGFIGQSYSQLGQMGLYHGTEIVDQIAQLQTELNNMVNNNDFSEFQNWDIYRRNRLLPILQRVHDDLKDTVFDGVKSFRLHT